MKSKIEQSKKTKIATSSTAEQLRQSSDEEGFTNICLERQKAEVIFSISFLFTSLLFASSRLSLGCITVLLLLPKPLWRPSSKYLFITRVTVFRQGWCNICAPPSPPSTGIALRPWTWQRERWSIWGREMIGRSLAVKISKKRQRVPVYGFVVL